MRFYGFREKFEIYERTPEKVKPPNTVYMANKTRDICSLATVRKLYIYLNGGNAGSKEFIDYITSKYPECQDMHGDKHVWSFDKQSILEEFWSIDKFKPILEERGFDDFDRLLYWSSKELYA